MVIISLIAAVLLVGVDQLIKLWAAQNLIGQGSVPFIKIGSTEILNLFYVENTGAAFSFMSGKTIILSIGTAIVIAVLIFALFTKKISKPIPIWCVAMIISGGLGNLVDRVFRGYVIDFFEVRLFNFAIFNFADILVVCGCAVLIVYVLIQDFVLSKKNKADGEDDGKA